MESPLSADLSESDDAFSRKRSQRRRGLAPELRPAFDARVLAGEDVGLLAREFGFEGWYAARRAERVRAAQAKKAPPSQPRLDPMELIEDLGPIEAAIVILNCQVHRLRDGTYQLRGFRVGPREIVRAANEKLRLQGQSLIPYPGLTPYR